MNDVELLSRTKKVESWVERDFAINLLVLESFSTGCVGKNTGPEYG